MQLITDFDYFNYFIFSIVLILLIILINLINKLINYSNVLKQETELLIPAQTGSRTIEMYTSIERILSVDH